MAIVKDGKHEDAEEFLGFYLDALGEEMLERHSNIGAHKPAFAPGVEDPEGGAQLAEGQIETGKRDYMVRQLFLFSLYRAWICLRLHGHE